MAALLLIVIIAFCALAMDIGPLYNRKVELSGIAKAAAIAAARELNGTNDGITNARSSAKAAAERLIYAFSLPVVWDDRALSFSAAPDRSGTWLPSSGPGQPGALFYAKVDTAGLSAQTGTVHALFLHVLAPDLATGEVLESVIAGRAGINVAPIAVCAMSPTAADQRSNPGVAATELVEYGFRRGVNYDLMQLNPGGTNPVSYLVNPVAAPDAPFPPLNSATMSPFVCTGRMWMPTLFGGAIRVTRLDQPAPLNAMFTQLNARFDDYDGDQCSPYGAPPDYNIKDYDYTAPAGLAWMDPKTGRAAARSTTERGRLETIADLPAPPAGTLAGDYGPLWAHAKAAKYASPEPRTGYTLFASSDWPNLYKLGPKVGTYPSASATPYRATSNIHYEAPRPDNREMSTDLRRVLHIPLLACPVSNSGDAPATVLGVGRFFMTVRATKDTLVAEFGGAASPASLKGNVELFP
jgi:hypothetical protein